MPGPLPGDPLIRSQHALILILFVGMVWGGGCATVPLGQPVDDPQQRATLLAQIPEPNVTKVVYQTVIHWPGRELALIEVVKANNEGGLSAVGLTELGNTLYAVRITAAGDTEIVSKNIPLSDTWLVKGLLAELLIPWRGPHSDAELRLYPDGTVGFLQTDEPHTALHRFNEQNQWTQTFLLQGKRLLSETTLIWGDTAVPVTMKSHNKRYHYKIVREQAAVN